MRKRGLSQVVTTLLFVLLALGAVLLVWNLVRGIIGGAESEIDITQFSLNLEIAGGNVYVDAPQEKVSLVVKRNAGAGKISGVNVILEDDTGQSSVFREDGSIEELGSKKIDIDYSGSGLGKIVKVSIAPILDRDGEEAVGSVSAEFDVPAGRIGSALIFDGNDYVDVPHSNDLIFNNGDDFSISFWTNVVGGNDLEVLIVKVKDGHQTSGSVGSAGWDFLYRGDTLNNQVQFRTTISASPAEFFTDIADGSWHHLVGTYKWGALNEIKLYHNGMEVAFESSPSTANLDNTGNMQFGVGHDLVYEPLEGSLDDIRIYNKALTAGEVSSLFEGDYFGAVASGNLAAWYKFDDKETADLAKDSSGNGNDGTIIGATFV